MLRPLAAEETTDSKLLDSHHWFVLAVRRRLYSAIASLATPKRQLRTG